MQDLETQAALQRIQDRNQWSLGWFWCVPVSLFVLFRIVWEWHSWDSIGKAMAVVLIAILTLHPLVVMLARRKQRPLTGQLFIATYIILLLAVLTFKH